MSSGKIILDEEVISERGTSTAIYDYATMLQSIGSDNITILYNRKRTTDIDAIKRFDRRFEMFGYSGFSERSAFVRSHASVYYYLQIHPDDVRIFPDVISARHAVFDFFPSSVDQRFAYVSQWLSDFLTGGRSPVVPHIVQLPLVTGSLRPDWGVPDEALVVGRHGGFESFDIPFVPRAIERILEDRKDIWFVFVNTKPFISHERVKFLPAIYQDSEKANFIGSCDCMLHARLRGESFGLAMAEFLFLNKPVFCWGGGRDRNHLRLQPEAEHIYWTGQDLLMRLRRFDRTKAHAGRVAAVAPFRPETVARTFVSTFIDADRAAEPQPGRPLFRDLRRRITNRVHDATDFVLQNV